MHDALENFSETYPVAPKPFHSFISGIHYHLFDFFVYAIWREKAWEVCLQAMHDIGTDDRHSGVVVDRHTNIVMMNPVCTK